MKLQIKSITNIQTGLFAKPAGFGDVVYLQSKHFDENGQLICTLHPDLSSETISEKHLLKHGDVLFAAKGTKNFATVYLQPNPAVASTSFFVIRLTSQVLLPEYLAWFLNSDTAQSFLKGQAIGSSMPSISKQVLENLEITVPGIEAQKSILQITKLRLREKTLKQKIEVLREKQIQKQIFNALNNIHG